MGSLIGYLLASFFVLILLLVFKVVKANLNPLETMALLLRGPGNAVGHGQTITTELFLNRDCNENIDQLRIKAPVGSRLAWRINKKSAHGIIA
ncbi:hypothetical protein NA56DRAFT_651542 [Hyaloscypha hepaticicola]|uniref:Uncharacterized protein n=1 Tax=Hyaloscypha hepaticicola TaxID=2082293 RepID=A0A2J6PIA4_9HELO|nr:hypothetical protein NA56DRAFT_651542 [Hyaloscypha hepaticicola]